MSEIRVVPLGKYLHVYCFNCKRLLLSIFLQVLGKVKLLIKASIHLFLSVDVGRSCILVSMGGKNIMFDCGMHMGFSDEVYECYVCGSC